MAISATPVAALTGTHTKVWDIIATADADTNVAMAHGFGAVPLAWKVELQSDLPTIWSLAVDANNVTATKDTGAGTGDAAAQLRVIAMRPHSVIA